MPLVHSDEVEYNAFALIVKGICIQLKDDPGALENPDMLRLIRTAHHHNKIPGVTEKFRKQVIEARDRVSNAERRLWQLDGPDLLAVLSVMKTRNMTLDQLVLTSDIDLVVHYHFKVAQRKRFRDKFG